MAMTLTQDDIDAIAAAILLTPANRLATDDHGNVDIVDAPNSTAVAAMAVTNASYVRTELATELGRIDVAVSSLPSAQDVWEYTTRTLTQSSTSTTDSTAAGSIARRRGDSWSISLTVGAITGYTSLWFTVKRSRDDADSAAVLQIKLNSPSASDGLLYVNGNNASDSTKGSITVSDASTGAIVIAVNETITDDMPVDTLYYDVQALISGTVSTPDSGTFTISADVTRSIT